jgi:hypothetical protein
MKKILLILLMVLFCYGIADARSSSRYVLQWSAITALAVNQAPDENATLNGTSTGVTDQSIPYGVAYSASISCSTLNSDVTNVSTDIDINVIASQDGINYDSGTTTRGYVMGFFDSLGDNIQDTEGLTPGPVFFKLRLDNNDGVNAAGAKCRITVLWE